VPKHVPVADRQAGAPTDPRDRVIGIAVLRRSAVEIPYDVALTDGRHPLERLVQRVRHRITRRVRSFGVVVTPLQV